MQTLPVGYALNAVMILLALVFLLGFFTYPSWRASYVAPFAVVVVMWSLAWCVSRYGFRYVAVVAESPHAL